jgi:hypothetical protein
MAELDLVFNEAEIQHPYFDSWWSQLKDAVVDAYPTLTPIQIGRKYVMETKKGRATVQVTKENQKTWVMYELEGSSRPGCRWMIGKTWCTAENIQAVSTDQAIPERIKVK